jgi:predicted nucleic acid-binding protein
VSAPRALVLDAGPLIALVHATDDAHIGSVAGFRQLVSSKTRLIVPLPIVFEVYKWVLDNGGARAARTALSTLVESTEISYALRAEFHDVQELVTALADWQGTLKDALVALTALRLRAPVWTLNFRDLSAFPRLSFWTPQ